MTNTPTNQVFSNAGRQYIGTWLFALVWNALIVFAIIKGGHNILQTMQSHPIVYLFALFPLIGLWLIVLAFMQTLAWFKFGKTPLILDPFPGQVGGEVGGNLVLPINSREAAQAKVSLSCIHARIERSNQSKNHRYTSTVWQDELTMQPSAMGSKMCLSFTFQPPADLPGNEAESNDYHYWRLHVKVPRPGLNYDRSFKIPVQRASAASNVPAKAHSAPAESALLNSQPEVPNIRKTLAGREYYYGYGRSSFFAWILIAMGAGFALFAYYFFAEFTDFLPASSVLMSIYVYLIAFAMFVLGVFLIASSLTIEVNIKGINKQQRFFGYPVQQKISAENIVDINIKQNASSTSGHETRIWYCLKVMQADGKETEVGDSIEGMRHAESIKQQMLQDLGANWRPAQLTSTQQNTKRALPAWLRWLGKFISYFFIFTLLYDVNHLFPELLQFFRNMLSHLSIVNL